MNAVDELLKKIESDLHLTRRDLKGSLDPLREALDTYERAVEEESLAAYCRDHALRLPTLSGISRATAASRVRNAFRSIADFRDEEAAHKSSEKAPSAVPAASAPFHQVPGSPGEISGSIEEDEISRAFRSKFSNLTRASAQGKMLVFGAFAGRTKSLPGPLNSVTEWIDTAHEGNRFVVNAVKRMRLGSIFAVIICDQAIQHQHAEPVVAEARARGIPVGYAGKGGNGALARALEAVETALSSSR